MAWCRQAASHYLSQCWPRYLSPYGSWTNIINIIQWIVYRLLSCLFFSYVLYFSSYYTTSLKFSYYSAKQSNVSIDLTQVCLSLNTVMAWNDKGDISARLLWSTHLYQGKATICGYYSLPEALSKANSLRKYSGRKISCSKIVPLLLSTTSKPLYKLFELWINHFWLPAWRYHGF